MENAEDPEERRSRKEETQGKKQVGVYKKKLKRNGANQKHHKLLENDVGFEEPETEIEARGSAIGSRTEPFFFFGSSAVIEAGRGECENAETTGA